MLPDLARELFALHAKEYAQLQTHLKDVDAKLMVWHRAEACSQRLAQIPGVGPIGASLLVMKTPAPETFRSARHFAAWLGLTPKDHSTAGRVRLGVITRAGKIARIAWKLMVSGEIYRAKPMPPASARAA